jgi:hypothetical protein
MSFTGIEAGPTTELRYGPIRNTNNGLSNSMEQRLFEKLTVPQVVKNSQKYITVFEEGRIFTLSQMDPIPLNCIFF